MRVVSIWVCKLMLEHPLKKSTSVYHLLKDFDGRYLAYRNLIYSNVLFLTSNIMHSLTLSYYNYHIIILIIISSKKSKIIGIVFSIQRAIYPWWYIYVWQSFAVWIKKHTSYSLETTWIYIRTAIYLSLLLLLIYYLMLFIFYISKALNLTWF